MMNPNKIAVIAVGLAITSMVGPALGAEAQSSAVYVYKTPKKTWCAVRSLDLFKKRSTSDRADQYDLDQGTVHLKSGKISSIEEYRTTEDNEVSTLVDYRVNPAGTVVAATVKIRGEESSSSLPYRVVDGRYMYSGKGKVPEGVMFRRAKATNEFPFADLITQFNSATPPQEICQ